MNEACFIPEPVLAMNPMENETEKNIESQASIAIASIVEEVTDIKQEKKRQKKKKKKKQQLTLKEFEKMKEEIEDMKQARRCKVCLDESSNRVFLPCGHFICCSGCSEKIADCPLCRTRIIALVKVNNV